jgi:uncharacterized protein YoxC
MTSIAIAIIVAGVFVSYSLEEIAKAIKEKKDK